MRGLARVSRAGVVLGGFALLAACASCAHHSDVTSTAGAPLATRRARPDSARMRTIAPFPVPGDTSSEETLKRKMLNLPKSGLTTIAPLPPPGPAPKAPAPQQGTPPQAGEVLPGPDDYVQVDELPEAIERAQPEYPKAAREAGVSGTVTVQALVLRDGRVGDVRVMRSIPMLDKPAIDCVKRWRFKPARAAGQPVAVWVTIPIRFEP